MRVDQTDNETITKLLEAGLDFIDEDCPVDVCLHCYRKHEFLDDVAHPNYDETDPVYYCAICGEELTSADN